MRVFFNAGLGLFQLVNFGVDFLELFRVIGAIIFPAGQVGYFFKGVLVHIHRHILVADLLAAHEHGHRRAALFTDANGIDFHAERRRRFRRKQRVDLAGVVLSVRREDDDFAFCLQIAQAIDRGRQRVADGRGIGAD